MPGTTAPAYLAGAGTPLTLGELAAHDGVDAATPPRGADVGGRADRDTVQLFDNSLADGAHRLVDLGEEFFWRKTGGVG